MWNKQTATGWESLDNSTAKDNLSPDRSRKKQICGSSHTKLPCEWGPSGGSKSALQSQPSQQKTLCRLQQSASFLATSSHSEIMSFTLSEPKIIPSVCQKTLHKCTKCSVLAIMYFDQISCRIFTYNPRSGKFWCKSSFIRTEMLL